MLLPMHNCERHQSSITDSNNESVIPPNHDGLGPLFHFSLEDIGMQTFPFRGLRSS
jgi:hypothetical protein